MIFPVATTNIIRIVLSTRKSRAIYSTVVMAKTFHRTKTKAVHISSKLHSNFRQLSNFKQVSSSSAVSLNQTAEICSQTMDFLFKRHSSVRCLARHVSE